MYRYKRQSIKALQKPTEFKQRKYKKRKPKQKPNTKCIDVVLPPFRAFWLLEFFKYSSKRNNKTEMTKNA